MIATPSPSPTPRLRSALASAFVRRCISPNVTAPRSSMIATRFGYWIAPPAYAAAGEGPHLLSETSIRATLSGRTGVTIRVPSSALVTCSLLSACEAFTWSPLRALADLRSARPIAASPSTDLGGFVLAREALAAALHRGDELREVDLKRVEDLVGVVLGAQADLALARSRIF